MMRFELGLEEPDPKRAVTSAFHHRRSLMSPAASFPCRPTSSFLMRGMGLLWSAGVTLVALGVFGYMKATFHGAPPLRGRVHRRW